MSVLLGVDLGGRRIGIALGDSASGSIVPLTTLRRATPDRDAATIEHICTERGATSIVVGLPLHMDGSESEQSRHTRDWVATVSPSLSAMVTFRDERLSSEDARARMGRPPRGRGGGPPSPSTLRQWRSRIDREAAAEILQAEFDARRAPEPGLRE